MSQPIPAADENSGDDGIAKKLLRDWDFFASDGILSRRRPPDSGASVPHEALLAFTEMDLLLLVDYSAPNRIVLASSTPAAAFLQDIWAKQQVAQRALAMRAFAATGREAEAQSLERGLRATDKLTADWLRAQIMGSRLALAGLLVFLLSPIGAVLIGLLWLSLPWSGWMPAAVGLTYLFVFWALPVIRRQKPAVVGALFVGTLFGSIFGMTLGLVNMSGAEVWFGFAFTLGAALFFNLIYFTVAVRAIDRRGRSYVKEPRPQAALIDQFLSAYAAARVWEESPLRLMRLISRLEDAARRAELEYKGRRSGRDAEVQAWLDRFGTTIGAVLREHKKVALEVPWFDRGCVSRSLLNGLAHLLRGDPARLLVVEAPTTRRPLWDRYGGRAVIAAALIGGGMGLPLLLPDLIANPLEFRATAFVTAFFSLLAPDPKAAAEALKSFNSQQK